MSGIRATFARLWPEVDADELVGRYQAIERRVQAGSGISYRRVMQEGLSEVAAADGLTIPAGEEDALGTSLPSWPVTCAPTLTRATSAPRSASTDASRTS